MNQQKERKSSFKKDGMFNEVSPIVFELAKDLRRNMTDAEMLLSNYLKPGIKGLRIRRQHPIGIYIADFYCHKIKLIIEIDGSIHNKPEVKEYDLKRESDLTNWGYKVIRFTNDRVFKETYKVLAEIDSIVENLNKSS